MRVRSANIEQDIEKHELILEKSHILLAKKDREIAQVTGTLSISTHRLQEPYVPPFKVSNANQRKTSVDIGIAKERKNQENRGSIDDNNFNGFNRHVPKQVSQPDNHLITKRNPARNIDDGTFDLVTDTFGHFIQNRSDREDSQSLDYMPKRPGFSLAASSSNTTQTETGENPVGQQKSHQEQASTDGSEDCYKDMYQLMAKKQTLRTEMTELSKKGDTNSEYYRLLVTNVAEIDEMIHVLKEIIRRKDSTNAASK